MQYHNGSIKNYLENFVFGLSHDGLQLKFQEIPTRTHITKHSRSLSYTRDTIKQTLSLLRLLI